MLVDAHVHVKNGPSSADSLVRYLDRSRIDHCWLLTCEDVHPGKWPYMHVAIENVFDAYSRYPSRIIPMYAPDPARDDAAATLDSWYQKGIRGCGELKATFNWDSPKVRALLAAAARLGIPVLFHMEEAGPILAPRSSAIYDRIICAAVQSQQRRYAIPRKCFQLATRTYPLKDRIEHVMFPGYMLDFASLERALNDFSELKMVAHGPMFWKHISADAFMRPERYPTGPVVGEGVIWGLLREHPNLYADTSGKSGLNALARDPGNARTFLSTFENRILYGTDNVAADQRGFLDSLGLSSRTYSRIYGDNACSLTSGRPYCVRPQETDRHGAQ